MWVAGITQWAMWRAFEPDGRLSYPDFIETVIRIVPLYWVRLVAGILFFSGLILLVINIVKTIRSAPADYAVEPEVSAPPLVWDFAAPGAVTAPNTYDHALYRFQYPLRHGVHRLLEGRTAVFTVLVVLALAVGSLVETIPMFFNKDNVKEIASGEALHAARGDRARHLHPRRLLQLPFADRPAVPLRDGAVRRVLEGGRVTSTTTRSSGGRSGPARICSASAGNTRRSGTSATCCAARRRRRRGRSCLAIRTC